jgi:anti-sigma B factor antagonist
VIRPADSPLLDRLLRISSRRAGPALVVAVAGEIDAFTAPKLETALGAVLDQTGGPVIVDLGNVPFLASRGISVLVGAATEARQRERQLRFVVGSATPVRRPLQVLGLDDTLPLYASVDEALTSLNAARPV